MWMSGREWPWGESGRTATPGLKPKFIDWLLRHGTTEVVPFHDGTDFQDGFNFDECFDFDDGFNFHDGFNFDECFDFDDGFNFHDGFNIHDGIQLTYHA